MLVDSSRFPNPLVQLHVEEHPSRAGEIAGALLVHPGVDDLLHLLLQHALGLGSNVFPSVFFYESPDLISLVHMPLDRARFIPITAPTEVVRLDHRAGAELGMELGKHTLDFGIVAVWG